MAFGKVYSYGFYPFMWLWVLSIYVVMGFINLCGYVVIGVIHLYGYGF